MFIVSGPQVSQGIEFVAFQKKDLSLAPSQNSVHIYVAHTYKQTNTHTLSQRLAAWELGPLNFLGPHPAFALALQLSTSFTWE